MMDEQTAYRRVNGDFNLDRPDQSLRALAAEQHVQLYDVLGLWLIVR